MKDRADHLDCFTCTTGIEDHVKMTAWFALLKIHGGHIVPSATRAAHGAERCDAVAMITMAVPMCYADSFRILAEETGLIRKAPTQPPRPKFAD